MDTTPLASLVRGEASEQSNRDAAHSVLANRRRLLDAGVPRHGEPEHQRETLACFPCRDPDGNVTALAGTP